MRQTPTRRAIRLCPPSSCSRSLVAVGADRSTTRSTHPQALAERRPVLFPVLSAPFCPSLLRTPRPGPRRMTGGGVFRSPRSHFTTSMPSTHSLLGSFSLRRASARSSAMTSSRSTSSMRRLRRSSKVLSPRLYAANRLRVFSETVMVVGTIVTIAAIAEGIFGGGLVRWTTRPRPRSPLHRWPQPARAESAAACPPRASRPCASPPCPP